VASYSQGVSVTWNGVAFQEVTGLTWNYGGESRGRSVPWTPDAGSVSVECLGGNNTGTSNFGVRADVVISGGGQSLTNKAVWESVSVASEVNGVTRYTVTLKLLDN
jgi:hypothetical protein